MQIVYIFTSSAAIMLSNVPLSSFLNLSIVFISFNERLRSCVYLNHYMVKMLLNVNNACTIL